MARKKVNAFQEPERMLRARDRIQASEASGGEHDLSLAVSTITAHLPSPESARDILEHFRSAVQNDEHPDKLVMQYLADAFGDILNGERSDKALNLVAPSHRQNENILRDHAIAFALYDLLEDGHKQAYAFALVGEQFKLKADTIRGIWKHWKGRIRRIDKKTGE